MNIIKTTLSIALSSLLVACGGGSVLVPDNTPTEQSEATTESVFVCSYVNPKHQQAVFYYCNQEAYTYKTHAQPSLGQWIVTFYDASNADHIKQGRATLVDSKVILNGTKEDVGVATDLTLIAMIGPGAFTWDRP